jgi:hypothetical protein
MLGLGRHCRECDRVDEATRLGTSSAPQARSRSSVTATNQTRATQPCCRSRLHSRPRPRPRPRSPVKSEPANHPIHRRDVWKYRYCRHCQPGWRRNHVCLYPMCTAVQTSADEASQHHAPTRRRTCRRQSSRPTTASASTCAGASTTLKSPTIRPASAFCV